MKCGIFPENQRKEGLFAAYVNTWLKVKQESAGYSSKLRHGPPVGTQKSKGVV